eukprot:88669_1
MAFLRGVVVLFTSLLSTSVRSVELFMILKNDASADSIVSYDTVTASTKQHPVNELSSSWDTSFGGAICSDTYYAFVTNDTHQAVFSFNITSEEYSSYIIHEKDDNNLPNIYYGMTLQCTLSPNVLLAAGSYTYEEYQVTYYNHVLDQLTFSDDSVHFEVLGTFYEGYEWDTKPKFAFDESSDQVWGMFQEDKVLKILTFGGHYTEGHSWYDDSDTPYFVIPQTLKGRSFKGAMVEGKGHIDFVTMTKGPKDFDLFGDLNVTVDIKGADYLQSVDGSMAICGSTGYIIMQNATTPNIASFDIFTGKETNDYHLDSKFRSMNSIACK